MKKRSSKINERTFQCLTICFDHQMLSIAHGYDTYKLKFGQHGGNHPVANNGLLKLLHKAITI